MVLAALVGIGWSVFRPIDGQTAAPSTATTQPPPSATPTPPRSTVRPAATLSQLRATIPPGFRRTCQQLDPTEPALRRSLLVAAQCTPSSADLGGPVPAYSFYFSYADLDAATTAYRAYYAPGDLPAGDCTSGPAELPYERDGLSGTLRCYTDGEGFQVFAWTADDLAVVASVADRNLSYADLYRWWQHAGPLR